MAILVHSDLDEAKLHELSHLYGIEDNASKGGYMHAHQLDDLMDIDLPKHIILRYMKLEADKAHALQKGCK
jgi:hypothetical protein